MPGMHAREPEAPARAVEGEQAAVGDERDRAARAIDVVRARSRRADEVDLLDQRAARVLEPEQDHLGHDVVQVGRAERAGEAHLRVLVVADADEVDVALAVDLPAREEEHVDAALAGAVEQLAPAVGEEVLPAAAEQRHVRPAVAALARQHRRRRRNRRRRADGGVAGIADQAGDGVGEQLLVAEAVRRRAGHARAGRGRPQSLRRSRPGGHIRRDARCRRRSDRRAPSGQAPFGATAIAST